MKKRTLPALFASNTLNGPVTDTKLCGEPMMPPPPKPALLLMNSTASKLLKVASSTYTPPEDIAQHKRCVSTHVHVHVSIM